MGANIRIGTMASTGFARQFENSLLWLATNSSPKPPSLGKRRGREGNPCIFWFPLSFQERGAGDEFAAAPPFFELAGKASSTIERR